MPNKLVLNLKSNQNAQAVAAAQKKEQGFSQFIETLYGEEAHSRIEQFRKLLDYFNEWVVQNKILSDTNRSAWDPKISELEYFTKSLDSFLNNKDTGAQTIISNSKDMFERLVYLITHDATISKDAKANALVGLSDPLARCAEGAQGELQSRFIALNASSLAEQLSLFAKDVVESPVLINKSITGGLIHVRNRYLWLASTHGFSILGKVAYDQYGSSRFDEPHTLKEIRKEIDQKYLVSDFLDSVTSSLRSYLSDLKLKYTAGEEYRSTLLKHLSIFGISAEELDTAFVSKIKMSYTELSALLAEIHLIEITEHKYVTKEPSNADKQDGTLYILNANGIIKFINNSQSYLVVAEKDSPELFARLLDYAKNSKNTSDLEEIVNHTANAKTGKSEVTSPYLELNTDFMHYKILKAMQMQDLLRAIPQDEPLSNELGKATTGVEGKPQVISFGSDLKCLIYSMSNKQEAFFEKNGKYISKDKVVNEPAYRENIDRIINNMDINSFVKMAPLLTYEFDMNKWLSASTQNQKKLIGYLKNANESELKDFLSSKLFTAKSGSTSLEIHKYLHEMVYPQASLTILQASILPGDSDQAKVHNNKIMDMIGDKIIKGPTPKAALNEFLHWMGENDQTLSLWLSNISDQKLNNLLLKLKTAAPSIFVGLLSQTFCKNIVAGNIKANVDVTNTLSKQFKAALKIAHPKDITAFFLKDNLANNKLYNETLMSDILTSKSKAIAKNVVPLISHLSTNGVGFLTRWLENPHNVDLLFNNILAFGATKRLHEFFSIPKIKDLITGDGNAALQAKLSEKLMLLKTPQLLKLIFSHVPGNARSDAYDLMLMNIIFTSNKAKNYLKEIAEFSEQSRDYKLLNQWCNTNPGGFEKYIFPQLGKLNDTLVLKLMSLDVCKDLIEVKDSETNDLKHYIYKRFLKAKSGSIQNEKLLLLLTNMPETEKHNDMVLRVSNFATPESDNAAYKINYLVKFFKQNPAYYQHWVLSNNMDKWTYFVESARRYNNKEFIDLLVVAETDIKLARTLDDFPYITLVKLLKQINESGDYNSIYILVVHATLRRLLSASAQDMDDFVKNHGEDIVNYFTYHGNKAVLDKEFLNLIQHKRSVDAFLNCKDCRRQMMAAAYGSESFNKILGHIASIINIEKYSSMTDVIKIDDFLKFWATPAEIKIYKNNATSHNLRIAKLLLENLKRFSVKEKIKVINWLIETDPKIFANLMQNDDLKSMVLQELNASKDRLTKRNIAQKLLARGIYTLLPDSKVLKLTDLIKTTEAIGLNQQPLNQSRKRAIQEGAPSSGIRTDRVTRQTAQTMALSPAPTSESIVIPPPPPPRIVPPPPPPRVAPPTPPPAGRIVASSPPSPRSAPIVASAPAPTRSAPKTSLPQDKTAVLPKKADSNAAPITTSFTINKKNGPVVKSEALPPSGNVNKLRERFEKKPPEKPR